MRQYGIAYKSEWLIDSAKHASQVDISMYLKRHPEAGIEKPKKDVYHGKVAEFGLAWFFRSVGLHCPDPDVRVLPAAEKRHGFDLVVNSVEVSVKSCLAFRDPSWVFQDTDIRNPRSRPYIALLVLFPAHLELLGIVNHDDGVALLKPLRNNNSSKRAIYANDLQISGGESEDFLKDCELYPEQQDAISRALLRGRERINQPFANQAPDQRRNSGGQERDRLRLLADGYRLIEKDPAYKKDLDADAWCYGIQPAQI